MVIKMTIWSYLEPFLYTKEYLHLAEVSKKLNRPHTTTRKHLNFFEKQGVLTKTIKGRLTMYKINPESPLLVDCLAMAEKEKLIRKCKEDLILNELVSFLHKNLSENSKALIFGSAVGNRKKANDIDLLVTGTDIEKNISQFAKKFTIKLHLINLKYLSNANSALKEEIKKKHLIVQGSEEIVKWLL